MAVKIEIIDNSLVVTDIKTSVILIDVLKSRVYYDAKELENYNKLVFVKLYDDELNVNTKKILLTEAYDASSTPFTKETFLSFCRTNLGE